MLKLPSHDCSPVCRRSAFADINLTGKLVDGACCDPSPQLMVDGFSSPCQAEDAGIRIRDLVATREDGIELSCGLYGSMSVMGRRRVMEDTVKVALVPLQTVPCMPGSYDFFAVYDGHGGSGVAGLCRDRLHRLLAGEVESRSKGGVNWSEVMGASFRKMDEEVSNRAEATAGIVEGMRVLEGTEGTEGSTAVVAVVGREVIVVANCGDSRVVLCRGGVALPLSREHKPDRPDERERVEAAGGRVINWRGSRVSGMLATSRSIGDHYLKPYVIPDPEVTVSKRTESDNFLLIASDGLWDVVSNEMACMVAKRRLEGQVTSSSEEEPVSSRAREAANLLVELAIARGSKDNISVIVVELKKPAHDSS